MGFSHMGSQRVGHDLATKQQKDIQKRVPPPTVLNFFILYGSVTNEGLPRWCYL